MAVDPADLIGRATERSSILAALGVDGASSAAVILTGEAGVGKTAIWESIVADRRSAGEHVLISRATVAEARLPWVGLADLVRSIPLTVQACLTCRSGRCKRCRCSMVARTHSTNARWALRSCRRCRG